MSLRTESTAQLCCEHLHRVLGELADHLPVGVQVSRAAVVAHCGRRGAIKTPPRRAQAGRGAGWGGGARVVVVVGGCDTQAVRGTKAGERGPPVGTSPEQQAGLRGGTKEREWKDLSYCFNSGGKSSP